MAKYGDINLGQIEALINIVGGKETVESLLNGTSKITIETIRRLSNLTSVTIPANEINSSNFFKTREGLWTSDNFNNFILSGASKKKVSADETTIGYADLVQAANDAEIAGELPEGYVFEDVDLFLAHLATLIERQWGGKNGTLLNNNGRSNIFYVKVSGEVFAVLVDWHAGLREWYCFADRLDDRRWFAGYRAFSATAT